MFAIIGIVLIITCIQELTSDDGSTTEYYAQEDVGGETYVTVNYKAQAKTSRYTVLCDSFANVDNYVLTPAQGNRIVSAHFIVKNISDTAIRTASTITCTADGNVCVRLDNNGLTALPEIIEKNSMVKGSVVFEVPDNAAAYDIQYGEYVTIHIENTSYKNNVSRTEENEE